MTDKTNVKVAIPKELHSKIKQLAESKYMTTSQVVRMALAEFVERHKNEQ